jgi:alcohol dehydrogenase class IV
MRPFEFFSAPRIVFGRGESRRLGTLARSLGSRPMVVYNGGGTALGRVQETLRAEGLRPQSVRQKGEPTVADVERVVAAARDAGSDVLVGLGGGSAIDCAKAAAGVLANGGSPLDYMEVIGAGRPLTRPATPWVAVPTTAGTGAEVTRNAVVGEPSRKFKASLRSELLLPRVALVDPELGVGGPPLVTAASGMAALCQCVESFTSKGENEITGALAQPGVGHAFRWLRPAFDDGADLDAREGMALAALLGGICLTSAGLGAVHGFAAPVGANFPVPHGVVCAALLPHVIRANIAALRAESPDHPALRRYGTVSAIVGGSNDGDPSDAIARLVKDLRIPRLGQYGLTEQHVPEMVALARKASSMRYNPVVLSDDALAGILRAAI